jgi:hypothetical protein
VARGAVRGAVTAWLALVVLQVVTSQHGSGQVAGLFDLANGLVKRAMSPDVAAIPDHRDGSTSSTSSPTTDPKVPPAAASYTTVGGRIPVPTGTAGTTTRPI